MTEALATIDAQPLALVSQIPSLDTQGLLKRQADINFVIDTLMEREKHYGEVFPGAKVDSLKQAGAELMFQAFQCAPDYEVIEEDLDNGNKRFVVRGQVLAPTGVGLGHFQAECSTLEIKYRYRMQGRLCPACGAPAIMRSRWPDDIPKDQRGWYCNKKADGCGEKFPAADEDIITQEIGRIDNPDPADQWHTVRMMAQKRWLVGAARRTFALSARFVDAEGVSGQRFDLRELSALAKAVPGDKRAVQQKVARYCMAEFGKRPSELDRLEGSVVKRWLATQVEDDRLQPEDFGFTADPASVDRAPVEPAPPAQAEPPADNAQGAPDVDLSALEQRVKDAGIWPGVAGTYGEIPVDWSAADVEKIERRCQKAEDAASKGLS